MKLGILFTALLGAAFPLGAATMYTIDPTLATPITAGSYTAGTQLNITVTGFVNLNGPAGLIVTNPDGSLSSPPSASCTTCWVPGSPQQDGYQYFLPNLPNNPYPYPTVAGGDGKNHFVGGGGNYDKFPSDHSAWAPEGKQTTDTFDPGALRFGSLAATFKANPTAMDWFLVGTALGGGNYGGTFFAPAGGGTLLLVVVDTFYPNNTGGYTVTIDQVPEPAAIWLAFSGFAMLGLPRAFHRLSQKR